MKTIKSFTEDDLNEFPKLPDDWKWVKIGNLTFGVEYGTSAKSKKLGQIPVLRMGNIQNGRFDWSDLVYTSNKTEIEKYLLKKNDVLFNRTNSPELVGKTAIYKGERPAIFAGYLIRINQLPELVVADYLNYFLNCPIAKVHGNSVKTDGVNQSNINGEKLRNYPFPLPPLPEQRAIVSKIEQLFSELDNGISNLKLAQEQLKVYRQAVLKKAFEGELTKKWREQQTDLPDAGDLLEQIRKEREKTVTTSGKKLQKIKHFTEQELAELSKLPEEWGWERLEGVGYWTGGGTPSKQNSSYWNNGDVLWASPKDMKTALIVDTEDKITKDSIENSSAKWIAKDSILFVVRSGIIKRILPIAIAGKNLTTNQDLQSLTLFWGDKDYVFWYCQANEQIIREKCAKDGTTVDNIEVPRLKSYPIAICSLPEQQAIVQEIETRLSVCDKIEQDIKDNLEKAEALRQSILKKAFEGKLLNEKELAEVRGAEGWEPAEVLLERIKAEKAENGKKGKQISEQLKSIIQEDKEIIQQATLQAFEQIDK